MKLKLAFLCCLFIFCGAACGATTALAQTSATHASTVEAATPQPQGEAAAKQEAEKPAPVHLLTAAQRQALEKIQAESKKQAALPAMHLALVVKQVYDNMLSDKPDEALRQKLSQEMKETTWALLSIKGQSIREMVNVLTPEQKRLLKTEMLKPGAPADLSELLARTFNLLEK